jgi:hypothetical protein
MQIATTHFRIYNLEQSRDRVDHADNILGGTTRNCRWPRRYAKEGANPIKNGVLPSKERAAERAVSEQREELINCVARPRPTLLTVKECIPGSAFLHRSAHLRTAFVSRAEQALCLPWIERIPGEKRIKRVHGQTFVMQHYVGCTLIRAHICHDEGVPTPEA